jgi:hypothetical protein
VQPVNDEQLLLLPELFGDVLALAFEGLSKPIVKGLSAVEDKGQQEVEQRP